MDTPSGESGHLFNKRPDIHKLAKQGNYKELLQCLKDRGEGAINDVDEKDARGLTALQHAVLNNRPAIVELLLFEADKFSKKAADHTVKDEHGQTLAHYAAKTVRGKTRNAPEFRVQGGLDSVESDAKSSGSDARTSTSSNSGGSGECMELLIKKDKEANEDGEAELIYVTDYVNKQTPLHYAVVYGSSFSAEKILEADRNRMHDNLVHWQDYHGMTPLHLAATYNQVDIARQLLAENARVTDVDNTNSTPLHYVCATGNIQMVTDILGRFGDDPQGEEDRKIFLSMKDNGKNTCLHIAAESGHYQVVQKLLKSGASASEGRRDTMSPLHLAVISGNVEIVTVLLEHIGSYSSRSDSQAHSTPLHLAAQHNRVPIAELLLKHENNKQVNMTDRDENTPLHIAAQYGNPEMVKLLMKKEADIHRRNARGRIPLHGAAENNNKTALEEILKPGNSPHGHKFIQIKEKDKKEIGKKLENLNLELNKTDGTEDTEDMERALQVVRNYLAKHGKTVEDRFPIQKIKSIVKLHGKGINRKSSVTPTAPNGTIPMKLERQKTTVTGDQVDRLLKRIYKDNIVNTEDHDGNTPLHLAASNGHVAIVRCLLKHDAEYDRKNDKETTALHLAAAHGNKEVVEVIVEEYPNAVFAEDETCNTPLHLAAKDGHKDTVDLLIAKGANVNQINLHKKTPIDLASEFGQLDICKQLVKVEAQSWLDKDDVSSLHLACAKGHLKVVKLLLKTVDDVTYKDCDGLNCLDIAIKNGHKGVARYIIESDYWEQAMRNSVPLRPGSKKIDTPMRRMIRDMPDVAAEVLDKCCKDVTKKKFDESKKTKKKYEYNYEFIDDLMTKTNWSVPAKKDKYGVDKKPKVGEYAAYTHKARVLKKNHPLKLMVTWKREELLQHHLVMKLIRSKWWNFGAYYYLIKFFIHILFLVLLTRYVIITKPPHVYSSTDVENILKDNCAALSFDVSDSYWQKVMMYILMVIGAAFEIIQLFNMRYAYFLDFENYVDWIVYLLSFLFLLDFNDCTIRSSYRQDWQWSVGAFALFFSWIDLVMYLKAFTSLGLYVIMFQLVCWTFVKVFIVFFSLILAFALGFFTLLQNQVAFRDIPNSILKTAVMFLGEIDYNDLFNGGVADITVIDTTNLLYPTATSVIFSFFITLACIVLMNLLVGLAVDDIKGILRKAAFKRTSMHIDLVLDVEKVLFERTRRWIYIKRDMKRTKHDEEGGCHNKLFTKVKNMSIWWWNQTVEPDESAALDMIPEIASKQQQLEEKIDERLEKIEKQMNTLLTSLMEMQTHKNSKAAAR